MEPSSTASAAVAPSPRLLQYCRQLYESPSSTKTLNLRHLGEISASDLTYLPHRINSLWLGPAFRSPISEIIKNLPTGIQQLDLDLTADASLSEMMNVHQHQHDGGHNEESTLMCLLFQRVMSLESLSLRAHGCSGARSVAKNLHKARRLLTLDFRSNHMGDAAVQVLCHAILRASECRSTHMHQQHQQQDEDKCLQHLILSWNDITDVGVYALCHVLKNPYCQLKSLDLSFNDDITDAGFAAICKTLQYNKSLERLTLFSCNGITDATYLRDLLVHDDDDEDDMVASSGTLAYNYSLKYVDLGATPARARKDVMEQIGFGLALNRAGRLQLRHQHDDFSWILRLSTKDEGIDAAASAKSMTATNQWWQPAHELVPRDNPLEDLSVTLNFLRQTSAYWSTVTSTNDCLMTLDSVEDDDVDAMMCD